MSRTFAYARVSKLELTTSNQLEEIRNAGFAVEPQRIVEETVSGSTEAFKRPMFAKLVDRLEKGDVLIVTKLDRLGRSALDVRSTVEKLAGMVVRVHCLQLGGADLTSSAGKLIMGVLSSMAEFERDLIIERTQAGLARAKAEGTKLGRKASLSPGEQQRIRESLERGVSVSQLARDYSTSRATILRAKIAA
ncbi:putative DNA-invertase from lambdoid prophage Rac [Paraburkholderia sp. BL6665CI2N2]|uniref:recombinase family protein n=1 Tax=Paraburkholderia sp. BL6665CI2N2 TaxID=1938806 RepID=UPI001065FD11|nr:recombinase family protein [Paraburkholderia sp. BL6665CI2N2]TDY24309.1 putative DNA-invertase from lambdoid prophage Rac [Paraburkholderia sp. BL6665CI2N2]